MSERNEEDRQELAKKILELGWRQRREPPTFDGVQYRPAIVTFIDLLGFSDFIRNERVSAKDIAQVLSVFYRTGATDYADQVRVYAFSDSIVRVRTLTPDGDVNSFKPSPLRSEIYALAAIQFELACWYGLFLRGGVSQGDVYADDTMVFGPGLIDAYILESQQSVYPRILIDPNIFRKLHSTKSLWTQLGSKEPPTFDGEDWYYTATSFQDVLVKDEVGRVFIDYMNAMIKGADLGFLIAHRDEITSSFFGANLPRVQQKYAWLAHFHNFTIRTDINYLEIGLCEHRFEDFSILDRQLLSMVAPSFTRIRKLDHTTQSGFSEVP